MAVPSKEFSGARPIFKPLCTKLFSKLRSLQHRKSRTPVRHPNWSECWQTWSSIIDGPNQLLVSRITGKVRSSTNLDGKRVRREQGAFGAESAAWTARTRPARLGSRGPLSTSTHALSSGGDFENGLNARCASTAGTCAILAAPAAGWLSNVR